MTSVGARARRLAGLASDYAAAQIPSTRIRRWTGILSTYLIAQGMTQMAGLAAGLLFVNFMPVREFALYMVALSVAGFLALASDLGSTSSLFYFFRRCAETGDDYGRYLAAVRRLQRLAFAAGVPVVLASLAVLATARGFAPTEIALASLAALAGVWFQISASIRITDLRLRHRFGRAYGAELVGAFSRLVLAGLLLVTSLLSGWLGILSNAIGAAASMSAAGRRVDRVRFTASDLAPARRAILWYLAPTVPSALYYALQGPLVVWLAATFGSTRTIAEVGALGRLGLVIGIVAGLVGVVILPRLAATSETGLYLRRYLQYGSALLVVAAVLVGAAALFPSVFLLILGPHYSGLHAELLLVVSTAGANLMGAYMVGVNNARGWTRWQGVATAVLVVAQTVLVVALPLGTTAGVLRFNLISALVATGTQVPVAIFGFWPRAERWR